MENPGLNDALWAELDGRLWHATSPAGLEGILTSGEIRITSRRYAGSLCLSLNGVCLFDFGPSAAVVERQLNNWYGWFGQQQNCRVSAWLEIDRDAVRLALRDAGQIRVLGRTTPGRLYIPGVEACHVGPVPMEALRSVLLIDRHDLERFMRVPLQLDAFRATLARFEASLPPPPPEHPMVKAFRLAEAERKARPDAV
jgi:hypothetical protein